MALLKTVRSLFPGFGIVTSYGSVLGANALTGATTVVLNTNTSVSTSTITPLSGTLSNGRIRVRTNTVSTGTTTTVGAITATDGTTTIRLYGGDGAATAANVGLDEVFDFLTNLTLNSFSILVTTGTNNATVDVEIAGNL